jgi:putative SOS response-associated peptidase YedK
MVEQITQGDEARHFQRTGRNRCDQADVPRCVKSKRCLIPASGWYEWHDAPGGKQPYSFTPRDGQPITYVGLWSNWKNKETGENLQSCTTEPNKLVAEVHDGMPVILEAKDFEQWERGDVKDAAALMKPAAEGVLQKWPLSKRMNSSRPPDDDASLIESIENAPVAV